MFLDCSWAIQCVLNDLAPVSPPPLKPRQNSRPSNEPPKKPLSEGSNGSTASRKDCTPDVVDRFSKTLEASQSTDRTTDWDGCKSPMYERDARRRTVRQSTRRLWRFREQWSHSWKQQTLSMPLSNIFPRLLEQLEYQGFTHERP